MRWLTIKRVLRKRGYRIIHESQWNRLVHADVRREHAEQRMDDAFRDLHDRSLEIVDLEDRVRELEAEVKAWENLLARKQEELIARRTGSWELR